MRGILLWCMAIFVIFWMYINTFSYEITQKDRAIVQKVETKIFKMIDNKNDKAAKKIFMAIKNLSSKYSDKKRIVAILNIISKDIDEKYIISHYGIAAFDTPILKTKDFKKQFGWVDGGSLKFDNFWEIDSVEHIAPKGSIFMIVGKATEDILEVVTEEYPFSLNKKLYIHKNFLGERFLEKPNSLEKVRPPKEKIIELLKSIEWADYVWWWNIPEWIPKMLEIFPPKIMISDKKREQWMLKWVDCSGLIYWASWGTTPRNTSAIVHFWESVDIEGKSLDEIISTVKPLDIIVRRWHMMIVLDDKHTIESSYQYWKHIEGTDFNGGVKIRKFSESLWRVLKERVASNNYDDESYKNTKHFVIRRWMK